MPSPARTVNPAYAGISTGWAPSASNCVASWP